MRNRLGGLARRATYIEQLRQSGIPLLHLDAGDAFQQKYSVTEADQEQVMAAAEVFLSVFRDMGVQAYNIGDRDLAMGVQALQELARKASFPILSANLTKEDKLLFAPSTIVEVGGYRVGVIGVVTALFVNKTRLQTEENVIIGDPTAAVKTEADKLGAKGVRIIVVLAHLNDSEIEAVAKAVPTLTAILGGQSNRAQRQLKNIQGVYVAGAYMRGKNVSVLDLHVRDNSLKFVDRDRGKTLRAAKVTLERQVKGRERSIELAKKDEGRKQSLEYLERNLVQLRTDLQVLELDLEDLKAPDPDASFVRWELKGMGTSFEDHEATAATVKAYRDVHPDPTKKKKTPTRPPLTPPAAKAPIKR